MGTTGLAYASLLVRWHAPESSALLVHKLSWWNSSLEEALQADNELLQEEQICVGRNKKEEMMKSIKKTKSDTIIIYIKTKGEGDDWQIVDNKEDANLIKIIKPNGNMMFVTPIKAYRKMMKNKKTKEAGPFKRNSSS